MAAGEEGDVRMGCSRGLEDGGVRETPEISESRLEGQ